MSFEEVMRLAQQKGFFFKTADSYPNSPAGFWDYGPLGVSMKNKFVELWRRMIVKRDEMVEIDGSQILPRAVFEASGHLSSFTDPFVQCSKCGSVFRPDKLIEEKTGQQTPEKLDDAEYDRLMADAGVKCLKCGSRLFGTKRFNMMFRVGVGAQQEEAYLRPETCQSIFVDSPLLFKTQRIKLPVGFAQVGRSFRNEIAPRQGLIRMRELNQAEVEVLFNPKKTDLPEFSTKAGERLTFLKPDGSTSEVDVREALASDIVPNALIGYYLAAIQQLYLASGVERGKIRFRILSEQDRAFYSRAAYDLEVSTSIGWVELVACNYRSDYDLGRHSKVSGTDFAVDDEGEKVLPHVFELSLGVDRSLYVILEASMKSDGDRKVLQLRPFLAPIKLGVFPLVNKDGLPELARKVYREVADVVDAFYDDSGSIGRRYARSDEVGIPFCATVDYGSLTDSSVTLRDRNTRAQERVKILELKSKIVELTKYPSIFG
jgi:glycyl-tRNA synthetase